VSVFEGIIEKLGPLVEVKYTKGCDVVDSHFPESEIISYPPGEKEIAEINKAKELAKISDVAIVVLGEDEKIVGESKSRTSLDLPGYQLELVKAVYETGTPTIVVLINGRPLTINWIDKNVYGIIEAWFPGPHGGTAIADVLFGDYNPGGKLPLTFPKSVGQIPLNFPFKPASDLGDNTSVRGVLYPFGYGLSYTQFKFSNLKISHGIQSAKGNVEVTFDIENAGKVKGDEVVQLYIHDETSSVTTYVKNLRGFNRVSLNPGEKKNISFTLKPEDLMLINRENKWIVEPGKFIVMIGSSSEDIKLEGSFFIK
jgi:beta-glucosidase